MKRAVLGFMALLRLLRVVDVAAEVRPDEFLPNRRVVAHVELDDVGDLVFAGQVHRLQADAVADERLKFRRGDLAQAFEARDFRGAPLFLRAFSFSAEL